jgi:hypothetical protein
MVPGFTDDAAAEGQYADDEDRAASPIAQHLDAHPEHELQKRQHVGACDARHEPLAFTHVPRDQSIVATCTVSEAFVDAIASAAFVVPVTIVYSPPLLKQIAVPLPPPA